MSDNPDKNEDHTRLSGDHAAELCEGGYSKVST